MKKQGKEILKENEKAMKQLPHGREILSVMKSLEKLGKGQSSVQLLQRLIYLVSQEEQGALMPLLYPRLLALTLSSGDMFCVTTFRCLRMNFYMREDLEGLTDLQIREYVGGLYRMRYHVPITPQKEVELPSEFVTAYVWEAVLFWGHSWDLLCLERGGKFDGAFKVACPHCGNDVHSLVIDSEDLSKSSKIRPRFTEISQDQMLFCLDFYKFFYQIAQAHQEEHYTKILPYLYGTYQCGKCGESSVVMDALQSYLFREKQPFLASDRFLSRIWSLVVDEGCDDLREKWELIRYYMALYHQRKDLDWLSAYLLPLEACVTFGADLIHPTMLPQLGKTGGYPRGVELFVEEVESILALHSGSTVGRGEVLCALAFFLEQQVNEDGLIENPTKVLSYYVEGVNLLREIWGEEDLRFRKVYLRELVFRSKMGRNLDGRVDPLMKVYKTLEGEKDPYLVEGLQRRLSVVYEEAGYHRQAGVYLEKALFFVEQQLGAGSEVLAFEKMEVARLYFQGEDHAVAVALYRQVVEVLLPLVQVEFVLPDIFVDRLTQKRGSLKKEHREDALLRKRVVTLSVCFLSLGDVSYVQGVYGESLEYYRKSRELFVWLFGESQVLFSGDQLYKLGCAYGQLGDKKSGLKSCKQAMAVYEQCLKEGAEEGQGVEERRADVILLQSKLKAMVTEV